MKDGSFLIGSPEPIPFFAGKRVVVTGATGLIGSYVVGLLDISGTHVRAMTHRRVTWEKYGWAPRSFDLFYVDLETGFIVRDALEGADVVLSCAGITGGVGLTQVDPVSYASMGAVIALNTLHAAHLEGVPLLGFLSSTTVYPPSNLAVTEDRAGFCIGPKDAPDRYFRGEPYPLYAGIGYSKRYLEQMCAYYSDKTTLKCAIVRPSGAYGRFDNFDEKTSHVIPGMIRRAVGLKLDEPFTIWGDGKDVRDFIHAQDVARGLLLATAALGEGKTEAADPFNIASGIGTATKQLANGILAFANPSAEIVCDPSKPSALKTRLVSIEKARRVLGFEPQVSLAEGLRDTIDWYKETRR